MLRLQEQAAQALGQSTDSLPGAEYRPHAPTAQQSKFLELHCLEALFGGAAGGGKSDALLMDALQYVHVPGYAALLLRRTYADLSLPGALMDRARDWWSPTAAKWRDNEKTWVFPSGASITFGYLETERNKYRYQGAEFQYVGFDELTQFSETQYRYLLSRLRRLKGSEVPLRMRGATNPGGVGHEWVKTRFGLGHGSDGQPLQCPDGRVFIPAKLEDNPHLDREEYEKSLAELDPVTRAQLRSGNWDVLPEGVLFQRGWFEIVEAAPAGLRCVRFWDLAATEAKAGTDPDWTVGVKLGVDAEGTYYV
ncbi:MAG: terminase large subunit domain-containing protein [Actinomycetota bacterium]